jgi:hypothetical protein
MSKPPIDLESLNPHQLRLIAQHYSQFCNLFTNTNNGLSETIALAIQHPDCPPLIANTIGQALRIWSTLLNTATEASNAEVGRIIDGTSTHHHAPSTTTKQ